MSKSKYIVFQKGSFPEAVIFPETIEHRDMVDDILNYPDHDEINNKVLGAGFVGLRVIDGVIKVSPHGKAVSLGIESRGNEDIRPLENALGLDDCY